MNIFVFFILGSILSLIITIVVHEFGHMLMAYMFGYELRWIRLLCFHYNFQEKKWIFTKKIEGCFECNPICNSEKDIPKLILYILGGIIMNLLCFLIFINIKNPTCYSIAFSSLIAGLASFIPICGSDGSLLIQIIKTIKTQN